MRQVISNIFCSGDLIWPRRCWPKVTRCLKEFHNGSTCPPNLVCSALIGAELAGGGALYAVPLPVRVILRPPPVRGLTYYLPPCSLPNWYRHNLNKIFSLVPLKRVQSSAFIIVGISYFTHSLISRRWRSLQCQTFDTRSRGALRFRFRLFWSRTSLHFVII